MSKQVNLKRGLDIKLKGLAAEKVLEIQLNSVAIKPTDFHGVIPKLNVRVGDKVKRGSVVFFDKNREDILFTSPVSGTVTEILRGEKRKILEIQIELDQLDEFVDFGKGNPASMEGSQIKAKLLESGLWSFIRQRPYTVIANPNETPKAIFISGFDSAPLAANIRFLLAGQDQAFQFGIDALAKLTKGKVHLGLSASTKSEVLSQIKGVEINYFNGPHPAGNVGIQIHHISPINKGEVVWVVQPQEVVAIGNLFLQGQYNSDITIAVAGSEVKNPQYYKVKRGAEVEAILKNNLLDKDPVRIISGNVLTGTKIDLSGYLSYYHNLISVIPEGNYHAFFGWLIPSPKKHSFYRTAFSWLSPNKTYRLDTNINGGERAFVVTGALEKVLPMDIMPIQLLKAIMIDDIEKIENLGIYELDEEDIALCEYISTSKINMQYILRNGLNLTRKEMS
jgi:Na+-transporting NADH:ubiquinone oxidoreductase subunit A